MIVAVCFTNFGPYHLARLRALDAHLRACGDSLIAYEVAASEYTYPWLRQNQLEPFAWITLFPGRMLESIASAECARALVRALDRNQPDVVGVAGYARAESMAAAQWACRNGRFSILMSESQAIDRPRVWWKEAVKRRRVRQFAAALVGGPRHGNYLADLGMPAGRITLGYNAVDNRYYAERASVWRRDPAQLQGLPRAPYFLSVCRFVPEKNLTRLIKAFAAYRNQVEGTSAWDLVLCGDGPQSGQIDKAIAQSGYAQLIHRPGFLQADALSAWYANAGAFVLPSVSEPWGLVVNEAASAALPLLVSERAGCAPTLIPDPEGTTGARFDPLDVEEMTLKLAWLSGLSEEERRAMGLRAASIVKQWGPDRFAMGFLEAIELADRPHRTRIHPAARKTS